MGTTTLLRSIRPSVRLSVRPLQHKVKQLLLTESMVGWLDGWMDEWLG